VEEEIITRECTEAEARETPFCISIDRQERGTVDWTVTSVEPNE